MQPTGKTGNGNKCSNPAILFLVRLFRSFLFHRSHLVRITDIYVPSFPYVHSPASDAGFLRRSFPRMSSGILGGRVDRRTPLFINLTHACVYSFRKRVSARPPGLPSTFYIAVCVNLFHTSFAYQPSACTGFAYSLALEACLLQYHP